MKRLAMAVAVALLATLSSCSNSPSASRTSAAPEPVAPVAPTPVATAVPTLPRLRYLVFGDSITQTAAVLDDGTYTEGTRSNWPTYFAPLVNPLALVNYAYTGAAYRDRSGVQEWQKLSHQVSKAIEHGIVADVVIVAAGTNDGLVMLGDYSAAIAKSPGELDRTNMYEALRWTFWEIRSTWPDATCLAVLPLQRADVAPESLAPLYDAIRQMAQRYNCIVIDATHESGIVADFEVNGGAGRDLADGLHPNDSGSIKLGTLLARAVRNSVFY